MSSGLKCNARARSTDGRCGNFAIRGTSKCRIHGGKSPNAKIAAARTLAAEKAARTLAQHGVPPIGDPLQAFADLASEAVALKDFFAAKVAELNSLAYRSDQGFEQVKAEVALYERAMDRAGNLLAKWVQLGIDERLVRVTEQQADIVIRVIEAVLDELDIDRAKVAPLVGKHLRLVTA